MVGAIFTVQDSLVSTEDFGLVGLNDLHLVEAGGETVLFATARGGGYLTGFAVGPGAGDTAQAALWRIPDQYLQLESVDLVFRDSAEGPQIFMAGMVGAAMRGLRLNDTAQGDLIEGQITVTSAGVILGQITEMALFGTSDLGLAAMRGGGLIRVSFGAGSTLTAHQMNEGPGLTTAFASDVLATSHAGQSFAFVSYGAENAVAMYRQSAGGSLTFVESVDAEAGLWVDQPGAMTVTTAADGGLYVVVAASGTDSLSVLAANTSGIQVVDHVLDTRNTRFDNASHVTSVTFAGQSYVLAAGADDGLSLFVMLPGGRLQHVETFEATLGAPLRGITALEAMATPEGIRVWAATEAAPFLSEFSISLQNTGFVDIAPDTGATLRGGVQDDVLTGGAGADSITAGAGDDILMDGAGADTLRGGAGGDTFIFLRDRERDVIQDFDPLQDVIDLSGLGTLGGTGNIVIDSRSWGAIVQIADEMIEVRTQDGTPLNATHFNQRTLITGGRVEVDPSLYPDPGSTVPDPDPVDPPPPPPPPPSATQLPGPVPSHNAQQQSPGITLNLGQASRTGTADDNTIITFGASDYIFGFLGDDTIRSGNGNDSVSGDGGNDSIDTGNGSDVVMGGAGFDTIFAGSGSDRIAGGSGADSVFAGAGNDVVLGGSGYDQIFGEDGSDSIWGGATADRLYGGTGNDFISAGSNFGITVDGAWGDSGNDVIHGDSGFDYLDGGTGNDTIDGGAQADNLFGRAGADLLLGGDGLDRLFGGAQNDRLYGGNGNDGHFGESGDDTLWGGAGNDRFFGGSGTDLIDGGTGADTIYAGSDFDTIVGGAGNDLLFGNFNADTFVFANFHGHDVIADFSATNNFERIDLSGLTLINSFAAVSGLLTQIGGDVVITTGTASSIRLRQVNLTDLDAIDFIF